MATRSSQTKMFLHQLKGKRNMCYCVRVFAVRCVRSTSGTWAEWGLNSTKIWKKSEFSLWYILAWAFPFEMLRTSEHTDESYEIECTAAVHNVLCHCISISMEGTAFVWTKIYSKTFESDEAVFGHKHNSMQSKYAISKHRNGDAL